MALPLVLALDIGTSSVRALVFDRRARPLPGTLSQHPYQPRAGAGGTSEVSADAVLRLVLRAVDETLEKAGPRAGSIAAVGVSTFWHGLLPASRDGRALAPLMLWSDTRSWRQASELRERPGAARLTRRTGCPVHSSYWPAKLLWLRESEPELWSRRPLWLSLGDLLYLRLFGRLGTSLSMASGTGLFDTDRRRWDPEALELTGISADSLPPFRESESGLLPRYSKRWPALASVPWLDAAGDGALANLGSGCADASQRAVTIGTSGAERVLGEGLGPPPDGLWRYLLDARREVVGGAFSNGGNLYAWLVRTLRVSEPGLERKVARMRPAAHGLTFLPLLAGERAPGYALRASGSIAGLTQATTPEQLVRAGLESVAIEFARVDARLDEGGLPRPVRMVGSGAGLLSSPAWLQIMADALDRPVAAAREEEASGRGAAVLALESLGERGSWLHDAPVGRTFVPSPEATAAYREQRGRQERLYRVLISEELLRGPAGSPAHLTGRRTTKEMGVKTRWP